MVIIAFAFLIFYLFTLPFRIAIDKTNKYSVAIILRNIVDIILDLFAILLSGIFFFFNYIYLLYSNSFLGSVIILPVVLVVPFYYFIKSFFGYSVLYPSTHEYFLNYFVLYLRSFKDDKKKAKAEYKLMKCLDNLFCTFEIGRPNEFYPSSGACRIYVGNTWKQTVVNLMARAPIILMRVNTTDNYLWEFEQCYLNKYMDKVLMWVTDIDEYAKFSIHLLHKYGLSLPIVKESNSVIYSKKSQFEVIVLKNKKAYKSFLDDFINNKANLLAVYERYFYGKKHKAKVFFSVKKNIKLADNIQRWNWFAFFLPEFFVICNRIKYRGYIYLGLLSLDFLSFLGIIIFFHKMGYIDNLDNDILLSINITCQLVLIFAVVLNLCFRFLWGFNGIAMVWLSENWESQVYFEEKLKSNTLVGFIYFLIIIATFILALIIQQF